MHGAPAAVRLAGASMVKREREEAGQPSEDEPLRKQQQQQGQEQQSHQPAGALAHDDDEDEEGVHMPRSSSRAAVKKGAECPYLDTVSRQVGCVGRVRLCRP